MDDIDPYCCPGVAIRKAKYGLKGRGIVWEALEIHRVF
jgi:hypothetical protein